MPMLWNMICHRTWMFPLHTEYCIFSGKRKGYLLADGGGTQGTCFSKKCWPSQGLEQVLGFLLHQKCVMCNNHIWIVLRCIELYLHASCALNSTELTHNNSHFIIIIIITIIIINNSYFSLFILVYTGSNTLLFLTCTVYWKGWKWEWSWPVWRFYPSICLEGFSTPKKL
jgi:hypothetical protein